MTNNGECQTMGNDIQWGMTDYTEWQTMGCII